MKLTVCHTGNLADVRNFVGHWIYADSSIDDLERVRALLGGRAIPLCRPQEFQSRVVASRDGITSWVDTNLAGKSADEVLLTSLSRSPFVPLLAHLVWTRLIVEALSTGVADVLVVTSSAGLARTLEKHAASLGIAHERAGTMRFLLTTAGRRIRSMLKLGRDLTHAVCRVMLARILLGTQQIDRILRVDILVDTYLYPDDVAPDGSVIHRYYPGLVDWYQSRGYSPAYYPFLFRVPLRRLAALYRGYRRSRYLFVPPELFYGFADILGGVFRIVTHVRGELRLRQPDLFDIDVSELVAASAFGAAMEGLPQILTAVTPKRMAESDIHPRWLLDWFENQSIDQATAIGFREAFPECRKIALRLYAQYSGNLLSFQVTNRERKEGLVPEEHWLGGSAWLAVATTYDSQGGYKVVPNLRSSYLHRQKPETTEGADLLILLTHSLQESAQVLAHIERVLPMLSQLFPVLRIKAHPSLSALRLKRATADRCPALWSSERVCWEDAGIDSLLASARLVISAGTSSAIEAVTMGIPVVLIGAQVGIDMCPLEFVDKRMWRIAFDTDQLDLAIKDWTPYHPIPRNERLTIGKMVMNDCFEPLTEDSMEGFALE